MKPLSIFSSICFSLVLMSCSDNDEPSNTVWMQPASITTPDVNGANQTFIYDDYGRVVFWSMTANKPNDNTKYTARYSYPNDNVISVSAEEELGASYRIFEETIYLNEGRAVSSVGTFVSKANGSSQLNKTYRLEFTYLPDNHLNVVKHSEVVGIGEDIKPGAWDKAWTWENYLIWEDGNLKESQDFQGNSSVYQTTRYEYYADAVEYPIIIPGIINNAHHEPLYMQGVFGRVSNNLVKSTKMYDSYDDIYYSLDYTYKLKNSRITDYTETTIGTTLISNPVTYHVTWTEK